MTVKELITKLEKCPQDYEIVVFNDTGNIEYLGEWDVNVYHSDKEIWLNG